MAKDLKRLYTYLSVFLPSKQSFFFLLTDGLIHTISLLYMTSRQLDNESINEEIVQKSKNTASPILWEEIHVLGDKPRRRKTTPHKSRGIKTK